MQLYIKSHRLRSGEDIRDRCDLFDLAKVFQSSQSQQGVDILRDRQLKPTSFSSMRKAISQKVSVGEQPRQSDLEELKKDGVTTVVTAWQSRAGFCSLWNGPTRMLVFACRFRHRRRFDFRTSR
jgi:hypothetical protein